MDEALVEGEDYHTNQLDSVTSVISLMVLPGPKPGSIGLSAAKPALFLFTVSPINPGAKIAA